MMEHWTRHAASHNDIFDAFRLEIKFYYFGKRTD